MIAPKLCFSSMLAAGMLLATANGHGYMTDPAVTFLSSSTDNTQFIATIESSASGFSGTFSGSPADNTAAFTTAFESSSYTSLKELISALATVTVTDATLTCGSCDPDETAQPLPATYVEWSHSDSEGFTSSHEGPCEVWCDDVRVFQDDDCAVDYTSAPAELPYDRDACLGASTLTFFWLALHSSTWQVYVNCAPLEATTSTGATSSYAVGSSTSTSTSTMSNSMSSTSSTPTSTTAQTTANSASTSTTITTTTTPATDSSTTTTAPTTGSASTSTSTASATTTSAPTTDSTSTATGSSTTTTGGSGTTSNQWTSTPSTGSTTNGGWSATSTTGSNAGTTQGQGQVTSSSDTSYNDFQATTGTVTPSDNTGSGGWRNNNNNNNFNNNGGGWGNGFSFRH